MQVQCCVCKRLRQGQVWVKPTLPFEPGELVSHGYCPVCAAKAFAQLTRGSRPRTKRKAAHAA